MPREDEILAFFGKHIGDQLGIVYGEHNFYQLKKRLEEISPLLGCADLESLHALAQKGITGQFRQLLLDVATNNETSFFRDPKVFRAIEDALKAFAGRDGKLRIWSAASSSGQEPLSLAIAVQEINRKLPTPIKFEIVATDISERMLQKARAAKYSQLEVQRGLAAPLLIRYFQKDAQDNWTAKSELTSHITYRSVNLKEPFPFLAPFDLILCRNVLIYQTLPAKREILKKIEGALSAEGLLVLGAGESMMGVTEDFSGQSFDSAVMYRKSKKGALAA